MIRTPRLFTLVTLALLAAAPCPVLAQGFFVGDNGAAPAGMGGAGVAYPEDLATAIYNPAGLVRVDDGIQGNLALIHFTHGKYYRLPDSVNGYQKYEAEELEQKTYIGAPFLAVSDNLGTENFKFAFSTHLEFGSKLDFDDDGVQRYMMKEVELLVLNQNFSLGWAVNDRFSVGGSLVWASAKVREDIDLDLANLLDPNALPSEKQENRIPTQVSLEDDGFGANVGFLYQDGDFKLGMHYQSAIMLKMDGDVTTDLRYIPQAVKDLIGVPGDSLELGATMDLKLPQYVRLGGSYKPMDKLWLTGEFMWIDWSTLKAFDVRLAPNAINVTQKVIERNWDDGIAFKVGADFKANKRNSYRAGLFYVDAPTKRQYIQLDIPDNNRWGVTMAWAHDMKGPLGFDIAYIHQFLKDWHIEDSKQNPPVNGDIEVNFGTLLMGFRVDF